MIDALFKVLVCIALIIGIMLCLMGLVYLVVVTIALILDLKDKLIEEWFE